MRVPRHPLNTYYISPYYHPRNDNTEEIPYRFAVLQEEVRCCWHLPLWLLFFGVTVSILTLLFLLTGTAYPIPRRWTRYDSHSLDVLKIAGDIYRPEYPLSTINNSTTHALPSVSYVESGRVFARTSSGDTIVPSTTMSRPSISGPVSLVDNTLSLLVQVRIPDTPRDARCTITPGITLTRRLESAGKAARVQLWSLAADMTSDVGTPSEKFWPPPREAHVSSFDVLPGEVPAQRSAEFACPPSRSLHMFEVSVSCADGDNMCSVEVWQGLFRVEVRT